MDTRRSTIPVVLFAYNRPEHLAHTLECLKRNRVPLLYAFSDGPRTEADRPVVVQVRSLLRGVDWCELKLAERPENLGLGRSILAGVSHVFERHEAAIVFEDDLVCVPGTYDYLCSALRHYGDDPRVTSVTGWTHPRVTPRSAGAMPYFDGRGESLAWGSWARCWTEMEEDALSILRTCHEKGIDVFRYGTDLPEMARKERERNIWAVRFLYRQMAAGGLCLRPPWSMVEHIGFDDRGTNARAEAWFKNPPLREAPSIPDSWPEPVEEPACAELWQAVCGRRAAVPSPHEPEPRLQLHGDYPSWREAQRACGGYGDAVILERTKAAALKVKRGQAPYERDSVVFDRVQYFWPLLAGLTWAAARSAGRLSVLDFGGALGSSYFQNRKFLDALPDVRWSIVEQPHYVAAGRECFQDRILRFYHTIEECIADSTPNVALFSGVLQYLEAPFEIMRQVSGLPIPFVIIDRTPYWMGPRDQICIQTVPPSIYPASYPSWIFSREHFLKRVLGDYEILSDFEAIDRLTAPVSVSYRGLLMANRRTCGNPYGGLQ